GEGLLLDPGLAVVSYPASLARVDDSRVAVDRHHDVGVPVQDPEAGEIADGALEARVLGAGDHDCVDLIRLRRLAHGSKAPLDLVPLRHSPLLSSPFTSAVSARLSGASTPWRSPNETMAPFKKSISVGRPASTSWSIDGLWS